jgi:hypothetical protein
MALSRSVYANFAAFPGSGVADVIYVDASNDNQFLWNGTTYVSYAPEPIGVLLGNKPDAWFTANPTFVLGKGQVLLLTDGVGLYVDAYKLGDGKTELQNLVWKGLKNEVTVNAIGAAINGAATATPNDTDLVMSVESSVAKKNTWTQIKTFLKTYFDTIYAATSSLANYVTLGTIQTITAQKTFQTSSNTPTIIATHTSGSGEVLQINKSGNGEGIIINKLSGSGAAMSVYGASINLDALTAGQILELDANKVVISAAKNSGYNLALGTTAGTVLEGNRITQTITNGVTTSAPSEDAVFDALALKKDTFMLQSSMAGLSPADATTYYFGLSGIQPNITATNFEFNMGYDFRVIGAIISVINTGTTGSAENNTLNLRNITTSTSSLISNSVKTNVASGVVLSTTISGLNITGTATDDICFEWITPTWATNPTSVNVLMRLYIEKLS